MHSFLLLLFKKEEKKKEESNKLSSVFNHQVISILLDH